jgi:hypothetical protein
MSIELAKPMASVALLFAAGANPSFDRHDRVCKRDENGARAAAGSCADRVNKTFASLLHLSELRP